MNLQFRPPRGLSGTQVWFELWSIDGVYTAASLPVAVTLP